MNFLKTMDDSLAKILIFTIAVITVIAVFMRYIVNDPLQWVEEVLIALYLWSIMIGAASAMKVRGHVSIDAFVTYLPQKAQAVVQKINDIIGIVVLVTFGWLGLQLALAAGDKITPILGISYTYVDYAVPVGAFWMALYLFLHLIGVIKPAVEGEN